MRVTGERPLAIALAVLLVAGAVSCGGGNGSGPGSGNSGSSGSGGGGSGSGGGSGGGGGSGSDGGSGGGGASACSDLVPTLDAGRAVRLDPLNEVCLRATAAPDGQVAAATMGAFITYHLYSPDGSPQGTISNGSGSSPYLDSFFDPTRGGWGAIVSDALPTTHLRFFDRSGAAFATSGDSAVALAPDPHGGIVMLGHPVGPGGATALEWFDGSGHLVRTVALEDDPTLLIVAWATEHVLTLTPRQDTLHARWYDGSGHPLTESFDLGAITPNLLHLLVDGSIALSDWQGWRGVIHDGTAAMDPAPAWLAARAHAFLATIRGGRGYAVFAQPVSIDATGPKQIEIVAADGESCGTVSLPPPSLDPGVTAHTMYLDVGQDGTVLETDSLVGLPGKYHCEFRWWPALLR